MSEGAALTVAMVAAEIAPYAKIGGLADVMGALPTALAAQGAHVCVVLPGYKAVTGKLRCEIAGRDLEARIGGETQRFNVLRASGPGDVPLYLIEHDGYFGRAGIYGENGKDYDDNLRRFIFFGRAAAKTLTELINADVIHAHDWHSSILPIVIRTDPALRAYFQRTASLFTIHNLAFQGIYDTGDYPLLNIDWSYFTIDCLEFYGRFNLMKGAIVLSDAASTVSPTYAIETSGDPEYGFGLEGVLRARGGRFLGILNGADYQEWNPSTDNLIAVRYNETNWENGKSACMRDLRERIGFPAVSGRPLAGMVTRMTPQKGFDLLSDALDALMKLDFQLLILGSGDSATEERFRQAEREHPDRLRVVIGFDNILAHRIQAGCDLFLMPSRFEPCGLTQMYALKYGTIPVVRATGGLADTVPEFDPHTGQGSGFVFSNYNANDLVAALERAIAACRDRDAWRMAVSNCFAANFSWVRSAAKYLDLYKRLHGERMRSGSGGLH